MQTVLRRIVLMLLSMILPGALEAVTYFVSTTGDDGNAGTRAEPFRHLSKAAAVALAGDNVIVAAGSYGPENTVTCGDECDIERAPVVLNHSGTPSASITFTAEQKWASVLDCQQKCDAYFDLHRSSYVTIQNFVITNGFKEGIHSNDDAHHITLRGNRIEYVANRRSYTKYGLDGMYASPKCHDFLIEGNTFHDIGRTNSESSLDHGLYIKGTNFIITDNFFYNLKRGWAIQLAKGAKQILIAQNTFAFSGPEQGGQIMLWNANFAVAIRDNIFYQPKRFAITRDVSKVNQCKIENNFVYGAGSLISYAENCELRNNLSGNDIRIRELVEARLSLASGVRQSELR
jgi:hypothetical protein